VLAFAREAYKNTDFDVAELLDVFSFKSFWKLMASKKMINIALDELNKSYRKEKFVQASQKIVPEAGEQDFVKSYSGVRAQLVTNDVELVKDHMTVSGTRR
jgi:L-2-hydroxyglutarate oxidase LhgO